MSFNLKNINRAVVTWFFAVLCFLFSVSAKDIYNIPSGSIIKSNVPSLVSSSPDQIKFSTDVSGKNQDTKFSSPGRSSSRELKDTNNLNNKGKKLFTLERRVPKFRGNFIGRIFDRIVNAWSPPKLSVHDVPTLPIEDIGESIGKSLGYQPNYDDTTDDSDPFGEFLHDDDYFVKPHISRNPSKVELDEDGYIKSHLDEQKKKEIMNKFVGDSFTTVKDSLDQMGGHENVKSLLTKPPNTINEAFERLGGKDKVLNTPLMKTFLPDEKPVTTPEIIKDD